MIALKWQAKDKNSINCLCFFFLKISVSYFIVKINKVIDLILISILKQ